MTAATTAPAVVDVRADRVLGNESKPSPPVRPSIVRRRRSSAPLGRGPGPCISRIEHATSERPRVAAHAPGRRQPHNARSQRHRRPRHVGPVAVRDARLARTGQPWRPPAPATASRRLPIVSRFAICSLWANYQDLWTPTGRPGSHRGGRRVPSRFHCALAPAKARRSAGGLAG
jgi:hypothetical protein